VVKFVISLTSQGYKFCTTSLICLYFLILLLQASNNFALMYSSSNSFLGSANGGRPAQTHFPQPPAMHQSYSSFPQGQHSQNSFMAQPTGFGGDQMQAQLTGYPSGTPQQPTLQNALQPPQFTDTLQVNHHSLNNNLLHLLPSLPVRQAILHPR
jgi:hypothetical protein